MKATIEIDIGDISHEWEPIAFRLPREGDHIVVDTHRVQRAGCDYTHEPYLIVRRSTGGPDNGQKDT